MIAEPSKEVAEDSVRKAVISVLRRQPQGASIEELCAETLLQPDVVLLALYQLIEAQRISVVRTADRDELIVALASTSDAIASS